MINPVWINVKEYFSVIKTLNFCAVYCMCTSSPWLLQGESGLNIAAQTAYMHVCPGVCFLRNLLQLIKFSIRLQESSCIFSGGKVTNLFHLNT